MDSTAQAIADLLISLPPEPETEPPPVETVPAPPPPGNPGIIFPHQQPVFRQLLNTARAFGNENWFALPILPRWHNLLVGGTGTGKSHLVRALGTFLGWPVLTLWVARWIIAGARGKETWLEIGKWLSKQEGKCIIFLDETDKLLNDPSLWGTHMRAEIFQLLDRDLPAEIEISDTDGEGSSLAMWAKAQKVLRCDCLILGAGAFQDLWDHRPKSLGFGEQSPEENIPAPHELKNVLPAELINRFGKILALPPLEKADYVIMIRRTAQALPEEIQGKFIRVAEKNLTAAIRDGRGARFCEECITEALLEFSAEKSPQKRSVARKRSISPCSPPMNTQED